MQGDYFTTNELMERWKLSLSTIRRKMKKGEIATVRIGGAVRFERAEVERLEATWKAGNRIPPIGG